MIKYALQCAQGHEFEGWFSTSLDYDDQRARNLVTCPTCETPEVSKAIMSPAVRGTKQAPHYRDVGTAFTGHYIDMMRGTKPLEAIEGIADPEEVIGLGLPHTSAPEGVIEEPNNARFKPNDGKFNQ